MGHAQTIIDGQEAWATRHKVVCAGPGPATVSENLFRPMYPVTMAEFANGDGNELGTPAEPGKMRSLRSSSALAVNFFEYWRYRDLAPLTSALGLRDAYNDLRFEQKLPTGLKGKRPNLDVVLFQKDGPPAGIECKFCEPYDATEPVGPLDPIYLPADGQLWGDVGMHGAQQVARDLGHDFNPTHLAAGQLLKHLLGLGHTFPQLRPVHLVYLWFDDGSVVAEEHRAEVCEFTRHIGNEVVFLATTYQAVFERLRASGVAEDQYVAYLHDRYFAS